MCLRSSMFRNLSGRNYKTWRILWNHSSLCSDGFLRVSLPLPDNFRWCIDPAAARRKSLEKGEWAGPQHRETLDPGGGSIIQFEFCGKRPPQIGFIDSCIGSLVGQFL